MDLQELFKRYPTHSDCLAHLEKVRWLGKPNCPYCKSYNITSMTNESRHHCNNCNTSFSATVGTIFHHTHLPLQKWFLAITIIFNVTKNISSRQLARALNVNKDTAWRISVKIREAMSNTDQHKILSAIALTGHAISTKTHTIRALSDDNHPANSWRTNER